MSVHNRQKTAGGKETMTKEQLGNLIIASEESMYHVAKTLLRNDADCADAIQEAIVKAFSSIHTLRKDSFGKYLWKAMPWKNQKNRKLFQRIANIWICMRQSAAFRKRYGLL